MIDKTLEQKLIAIADEDYEGDDADHFVIVERGEWEAKYKYQYRSTIVRHLDKYYSVDEARTGSYHTDYEYDDPTVDEVVPKQVTTTRWVCAKGSV